MKLRSTLAGTAVLVTLLGAGALPVALPASPAHAQASISIDIFYDELAEYGDWVNYNGRYVFVPVDVDDDWQPYKRGRWINAERVGWAWASDEPFGWATYHYGRWGFARDIGWYWVPGTIWAPAWVGWKRSSDYVAWAPLPPDDEGDVDVDVSISINIGAIPEYYWVAVPAQDFLADNLSSVVIVDTQRRRRIVERTRPVGTVVIQNNIVVNNIIDVAFIQERTGRQVRRVRLRDADRPRRGRVREDEVLRFPGRLEANRDARPRRLTDLEELRREVGERRQAEERDGDDNRQPDSAVIDEDDRPGDDSGQAVPSEEAEDGSVQNRQRQEAEDQQPESEAVTAEDAEEDEGPSQAASEDDAQENGQARQRRQRQQAEDDQDADAEDGGGEQTQRQRQRQRQNAAEEDGGGEQTRRQRQRQRQNAAEEDGEAGQGQARQRREQTQQSGGGQQFDELPGFQQQGERAGQGNEGGGQRARGQSQRGEGGQQRPRRPEGADE